MNTLQATAMNWIGQGIGVIPIAFRRKEPDGRALIRAGSAERLPSGQLKGIWEPYQNRLASAEEVRCFFPTELYNLAIVTGLAGLVVLDFDDRETFWQWWARYRMKTYMVATVRGVHVYLKSEQPATGRKGKGIDVKASGGYVLAPPSVHPSGANYLILWDQPIASVTTIDSVLPADLFPPVEAPKPASNHSEGNVQVIPCPDDPFDVIMRGPAAGQDLVTAIREKISLLDYLPGSQQNSANGRWWVVCCPFHDDHHPSMWIDTRRGICGCYKCGFKPLDVINLYAALKGIDNRIAIFELKKLLSV